MAACPTSVLPTRPLSRSIDPTATTGQQAVAQRARGSDRASAASSGRSPGSGPADPGDKRRLRLACDWYWSAIHADDPVTEYLQLWFVVEAVAMPNTTNIAPVQDRRASTLGGQRSDWRLVGRPG